MTRAFASFIAGWLSVFATGALAFDETAADPLFGADGLRISQYRSPTPDRVPHGTTVDIQQLQRLIAAENPVLIDVQAVVVRPDIGEFGMSWLPNEERQHLPGSTWLPNVGYGRLDGRMDRYFRHNLERLTGGDRNRPVVMYCVVDCWMSWNAIQRAAGYGYRKLYWFPGGTDEWAAHDLPMVEAVPVPIESAAP